ncbi:MAG TPA: hemolysin family protein [Armatimonadota bacterium]|nr:hemolysin family protein [Armatimonadota bacterium]
MSGIAFECVVILGLILVNGLLAMSEMAVVSSRPARLKSMAALGSRRAEEALEMARDPDRLLAAVQVGITLVAVLSGAYAGVTVAERLEAQFSDVAWLQGYAGDLSMAIVVVGITYLTLVLGELAPKRLALGAPERVALAIARPMRWVSMLTAPVVWLLTRSTSLLLAPFRSLQHQDESVTAGEIEVLVEEGMDEGVFTPVQQDLIRRALRLREYQARDLMIPRPVLEWFSPGDEVRDLFDTVSAHRQAYYPILDGDQDDVLGLVRGWDLLVTMAKGQSAPVGELAEEPVLVPETTPVLDVLSLLQDEGAGAALVVDEHGATSGMISMEGVLRAIGGRAALTISALDAPEWEERGDGSIVGDGLVPLVDFRQALGLPRLLAEEGRYGSVGGFMMSRLQKMPEIGDAFEAHGFRFEVLALDHYRVSKLRATPIEPVAGEVPEG